MGIVLDPGHGLGNRVQGVYDPGAVSVINGVHYEEADLTLKYGLCLEEQFKALGISTVMTRREKTDPCSLSRRVQIAKQADAELLVSLHFNAGANKTPDGKESGFEVLYRANPATHSLDFATEIFHAMLPFIRPHRIAPVDRQDLYVLSYRPSVLVETAFLDDADDMVDVVRDDWMHGTMKAVANAVATILSVKDGLM